VFEGDAKKINKGRQFFQGRKVHPQGKSWLCLCRRVLIQCTTCLRGSCQTSS